MKDESIINCGCAILVAVFNFLVGAWSVNYLLQFFLSKTISFLGAGLIGLIVAEISVPVALVIWLLKAFGVM